MALPKPTREFPFDSILGIGACVALVLVYLGDGLIGYALVAALLGARGLLKCGTLWMTCVLVLVFGGLAPRLSDDYHRYLWEGHVQNQGYSPYSNSPASLYKVLDHPSEGLVGHPQLSAIYPPLTQYLFRLADLFSNPLFGWKMILWAATAWVAWILRRRGWFLTAVVGSPLVLIEGLWNAHLDLLGLPFGFLLVNGIRAKNPALTGISLAVLTGVKIMPALLFPFLFFHFFRKQAVILTLSFCMPLLLFYLPFLGELPALFASFKVFSQQWYFNNIIFHGLTPFVGADTARLILAGCLGFSLATLLFVRMPVLWKCAMVWCALIVFSPTVYPWYLFWLLPFVPESSWRQFNLAYLTGFLSYMVLVEYKSSGVWRESLWWMAPEWLVLLFCLFTIARKVEHFELLEPPKWPENQSSKRGLDEQAV